MGQLPWFRFTSARLGSSTGIPVVLSRTGYTGELGYEVWCHPKHGNAVWDAIWEAGKKYGLKGRITILGVFLLLEGIGIIIFSGMTSLVWAVTTMLIFALFLKMSNGATYAVVPFINKKAIGAVSGIVGAGGNVGAVLAGFLFKSESITYRESLFYIGVAVAAVSILSLIVSFSKITRDEVQVPAFKEPEMKEAYAYASKN